MGLQRVRIPILQSRLRTYWAYAKRNNAPCKKDAGAGFRQSRMPQAFGKIRVMLHLPICFSSPEKRRSYRHVGTKRGPDDDTRNSQVLGFIICEPYPTIAGYARRDSTLQYASISSFRFKYSSKDWTSATHCFRNSE